MSNSDTNHRIHRNLTIDELVRHWHASRNTLAAVLLADELMLRLHLNEAVARPRNQDKL
jgi:hypothetical protein